MLAATEHNPAPRHNVLCVAENSRLGFKPTDTVTYRDSAWPNSENAMGIQPPLRRGHSRPPCSTYGSGSCGGGIYGFTPGGTTWASYANYLDWLQNLELAAGYNLIGEMGHCKGGDAICVPGHAPMATGNLGRSALDDAVNMGVAAPFDASLMEGGALFGTRYAGNAPLLNSNDYLRVGWTYMRSEGGYAWRATGKLLGGLHLWANPWRWF